MVCHAAFPSQYENGVVNIALSSQLRDTAILVDSEHLSLHFAALTFPVAAERWITQRVERMPGASELAAHHFPHIIGDLHARGVMHVAGDDADAANASRRLRGVTGSLR